ncbi:hypothetical protein LCGC14_1810590 [marine sediment metagenome]|uniref:Uncharacterized protein n=1 Tax=marine sediment metagenome TaxID=412755 RepID=A0A0F9H9Z5_9ZZZZ
MKRTKFPLRIGDYIYLDRKEYKNVRKKVGIGMFHTSEGILGFKIKIINKKIKKAILKLERYGKSKK